MSELKLIDQVPCPFCGTEGSLMCQFFSVRGVCRSCYSMGPEVFGKDVGDPADPQGEVSEKMMNEAIRRWNKRADLAVHAQEEPSMAQEEPPQNTIVGPSIGGNSGW